MMRFGKIEFDCIKCNGYGIYIQPTTKQEMLEYLEKNNE